MTSVRVFYLDPDGRPARFEEENATDLTILEGFLIVNYEDKEAKFSFSVPTTRVIEIRTKKVKTVQYLIETKLEEQKL